MMKKVFRRKSGLDQDSGTFLLPHQVGRRRSSISSNWTEDTTVSVCSLPSSDDGSSSAYSSVVFEDDSDCSSSVYSCEVLGDDDR